MHIAHDVDTVTVPAKRPRLATKRIMIAALGGLAAAAVEIGEGSSWSVSALFASDTAALVFVVRVWLTVAPADSARTARIARSEDASRTGSEAILVGAGAASLVAVAFTLGQAGHAHTPARGLLTALALASVALAWMSVHTVLALRYARLYYTGPTVGSTSTARLPITGTSPISRSRSA
jgi:uncharacterized membrane protein